MNELLFFGTIVLGIVGVVLFHRVFGKVGLFCWVAFASILANIEVAECVTMFGMAVTLGNVLYCGNNLAQDALNQLYGEKISHKAVWVGFFALIACTILSQVSTLFTPNEFDTAHEALATVFDSNWKIVVSSLTAYYISGTLNVKVFAWIKTKSEKLWVRSGVSTWTAQLVDSFIFTGLCMILGIWGGWNWNMFLELSITTYIIKIMIAGVNIPCLYLIKWWNDKKAAEEI